MAAMTYRWQENLYCGEHIVQAFTEIEPWREWIDAGNEPGADPEADLNSLAEFFEIDRMDAGQVDRRRFPIKDRHGRGFCSVCLHWFD